MGRLLKYLLLLTVAAIFWNCNDNQNVTAPEEVSSSQGFNEAASDDTISSSDSEFCLPRQISYANPSRVQTNARRTTGYNRTNVEFAKSGKIINSGLRYFIQRNTIIIHFSLIKPSHKLLFLGKLII